MWKLSKYALEFFSEFSFWNMSSANQRVTNNNWCLLDPSIDDPSIALFLPSGDTLDIDLRGFQESETVYSVMWYDPRNGGAFQNGSISSIQSNKISNIGFAPSNSDQDWAVLLRCMNCLPIGTTASPILPITTLKPATSGPVTGTTYPSSIPSGTAIPSHTLVVPDSVPTGKPSPVDDSRNATDISPAASPISNFSMPPLSQSNAGEMMIQSVATSIALNFFTLYCVREVILTTS
jgi:hypothetical protein